MIQNEMENSFDEGEISDTTVSDNELDLENLRRTAILSMIKTEKVISESKDLPKFTVYDIEKQLKECRASSIQTKRDTNFEIDKQSSFINNQKRLCIENDNLEIKRARVSEVGKLVENFIGKSLCSPIINVNMSKKPELKNKLIEIFKKTKIEKGLVTRKKNKSPISNSESESVFTNQNVITSKVNSFTDDVERLNRYESNINDEKQSIDEITKSIESMTSSIREKLQKSKAITAQIENLKKHKTDLHKDINETRSKISYLHKIKKQKLVSLEKYKFLKDRNELSSILSLNIERSDTLSTMSIETEESLNDSINCNQIICSLWIHGSCANKQCVYQHPKITIKPLARKPAPIKENDKVFLREMNPLEFITTFHCDACSSLVHLSNLHIVDDWHCKSCCQQIMIMSKPTDILYQLINIWHHTFRRYIMSQNVSIDNRTSSVLLSLVKCTEALQAKITNVGNIQVELLRLVGRHILSVFSDTGRHDDVIHYMKMMNYDNDLLLFIKTLSMPVSSTRILIADALNYKITKSSFTGIESVIKLYCQWSSYCELSPREALFQWLEMSIKRNIVNNYSDTISSLTNSLLVEIIGSSDACVLDLSLRDFQHDEKYWFERKDDIGNLLRLYTFDGETQSCLYLVLTKYRILSLFFTDNEESAIELCQKFATGHFYFIILSSKLSLKYNYPITIDNANIVTVIEHSFNKSEWLLRNRSEKSCVKILEGISCKLYRSNDETYDPLRYFQRFLALNGDFDALIANLVPTNTEQEVISIRQSSTIWMCYISLSVLTGNADNLMRLLDSDSLLNLDRNHLSRVVQFIFEKFGALYQDDDYVEKLKSIFLRMRKYLDFEHFLVLFRTISFERLRQHQLPMWLFLIDYSVANYSNEQREIFLTEMSSKLVPGNRANYDIFSHIILCYPISVDKVWLNFIQLILNLNLPLYTLADMCGVAVSRVKWSTGLWRQYYSCALKIADKQLIEDVRESAAKIGISL